MTLTDLPLFPAYAATVLLLCLNLLWLWAWSGLTRGRSGTAINSEDAERFGVALRDSDPPEVARVLRAHQNAQAIIHPFLFLGLVFVLAGGSRTLGIAIFAVFVVSRYAHTWAYLGGRQPWRTVSFLVGGIAALILLLLDAWLMLAA